MTLCMPYTCKKIDIKQLYDVKIALKKFLEELSAKNYVILTLPTGLLIGFLFPTLIDRLLWQSILRYLLLKYKCLIVLL